MGKASRLGLAPTTRERKRNYHPIALEEDILYILSKLLTIKLITALYKSNMYGSKRPQVTVYSGFRRCHCTMVCLGLVIMSCQCFVSVAPEPFLPET